ncbi:MAG: hypothetical protein JW774_02705 [Candidatus Aureabacteria bacterium]|nr:hypothetical protein [Candidatus Auribacterota bacterium]
MVVVVFGRTLENGFVYDDWETIVDNPHVHSLQNGFSFFFDRNSTAPETHLKHEIYRPIKSWSCALDHFIFRGNPAGYHLTNVLLHLVAVLLLNQLLISMGYPVFTAFMASLFFAVHPAISQNVSYISARADILATVFLLACSRIVFLGQPETVFRKIVGPALFFTACLAKETSVVFPIFYVFVYRYVHKPFRSVFSYGIAALLYLVLRQTVVGGFFQTYYYQNSFWITQAAMVKVWLLYIAGFFWPFHLEIAPIIETESGWAGPFVWFSAVALASLGILIWIRRKHLGKAGIGLVWFFLFLLPVANLIPIKALMAWRFVYIPWVGMSLVFCHYFEKIQRSRTAVFFIFFWLLVLTLYSVRTVSTFQTDETLWKPLMEKYPHLSKPYHVVGNYYLREKEIVRAQHVFETGLQSVPDDAYLMWDLARIHAMQGNTGKSLDLLEKINQPMRRELGQGFLYDYVFALYQEKKYGQIWKTLSFPDISGMKTKILLIQAHGSVLADHKDSAEILYEELLTRGDLTAAQREDCSAVLAMLKAEKIHE